MSFYPFFQKTLRDMGTLGFGCSSPHHSFLFLGWFMSFTKRAFFRPSPRCHPIPLGSHSSPIVPSVGLQRWCLSPRSPRAGGVACPTWHIFPALVPTPRPFRYPSTSSGPVGEGVASFCVRVMLIEDRILRFLEAISF